jgi:gas vesicle protein
VVVATFLGGLLGSLMVVLPRPADGSNLRSGTRESRPSVSQ